MSKRKGWSELSEAYRKRLERGGVNKSAYERGDSITKARGHSSTPERPADAYTIRGRARFKSYLERVGGLRKKIIDRKVRMFSDRFKWNEERAREYIMQGGTEVPKPGRMQLQAALDMTDDEIEELLHDPNIDDEWKFLWYH
jgi:hypothetical protein